MIRIRNRNDRGHADHGWLNARHTFSFASYNDPQHMHFRSLRVMNEDRVAAGGGFDTHPHRDMEIVTHVLEGKLEHRDSMGNGEVLTPGEWQWMSAGTGILHSEFNPSKDEATHLYQIWLFPEKKGLTPDYAQKRFDPAGAVNQWQLIAAPDGRDGALPIRTDAELYNAHLSPGNVLTHTVRPQRGMWLQVLRGTIDLDGAQLTAGDGAALTEVEQLTVRGIEQAELLLFDLA